LIIKCLKTNKKIIFSVIIIFFIIIVISSYILISKSIETSSIIFWNKSTVNLNENKDYIKWVDFNITAEVLNQTAKLDIESHNNDSDIKYNWIELLSYLACTNGGNFKNFNQNTLDKLISQLNSGKTIEELTKNMKYYDYYFNSYSAVLSGFIRKLFY
jgi:hypothetical protein